MIGHNVAGNSTTFAMLSTLIEPTGGRIKAFLYNLEPGSSSTAKCDKSRQQSSAQILFYGNCAEGREAGR